MRVALLGAGQIGRLHGGILAAEPGVDELIVFDVLEDRAREVAAAIGASTAETAGQAIDQADAVVITASTHQHGALLMLALDARKPTFVEKPLAFDLVETIALVREVESRGAVVQLGFQRRFDEAYREARRRLRGGELGTLYLVRLIAHDHTPPPDDYIPVSGGLFRDSAIHDFDALRWTTGQETHEVYAAGAVRHWPQFAAHGDIDTGAVLLTLADGTLAVHSQTRHNPLGYDIRMELVGSESAVTVGLDTRTPIRSLEKHAPVTANPGWDSWRDRFEPAYRAELRAFLRVARGEEPPACVPRDGLEATRVAYAATLSRQEHRPVRLDEIPTG